MGFLKRRWEDAPNGLSVLFRQFWLSVNIGVTKNPGVDLLPGMICAV